MEFEVESEQFSDNEDEQNPMAFENYEQMEIDMTYKENNQNPPS